MASHGKTPAGTAIKWLGRRRKGVADSMSTPDDKHTIIYSGEKYYIRKYIRTTCIWRLWKNKEKDYRELINPK